jgi:adenine-specific DNA-methyltransferase
MSSDDIKSRGIVFTPIKISKFMTSFIDNSNSKKILEPSCGSGDLLKYIDKKHDVFGIDINKKFINECKKKFTHFKFECKDFIRFNTKERFDYIIGNPPYVKIQNIDNKSINIMRNEYPDIIYGNTNLYAYFLIKCYDLLKDNGELIFIMPNTFLYNKSLNNLKKFLFDEKRIKLLIDFKDKQIFDNFMTYTCIIIITKTINKKYLYGNDINHKLKNTVYKTSLKNINTPIINYRIGLMTLCDDVYIIKNFIENGNMIEFSKNGINYKIEKDACKDILKVSKREVYKIIYPYKIINNKAKINVNFLKEFPECGMYLKSKMNVLKQRDNGNISSYPIWYAYGRTQSLIPNKNKRLFLSTIVKDIKTSLFEKNIELYYSGLCISSIKLNNKELISILKSNEDEILKSSNNKAGGWYGMTLNSFINIKPLRCIKIE